MEKDAYYFPHDCNARNDVKILKLRRILGSKGYGIFWMLIEVLREAKDYKLPLSSVKELSFDFRESEEFVVSIINDFELFQIDDNYFFFSESLSRRMSILDNRRKALSEAGKRGRQKQLSLPIFNDSVATPEQPPSIKVNKSKLNKEKYNWKDIIFFEYKELDNLFKDFLEIREKIKPKPAVNSERAINALIKTLRELSNSGRETAIKLIEQSIRNSWKDIYPLKENKNE